MSKPTPKGAPALVKMLKDKLTAKNAEIKFLRRKLWDIEHPNKSSVVKPSDDFVLKRKRMNMETDKEILDRQRRIGDKSNG